MKRIGLVGENPNDTNAIKNLLSRYFQLQFIPVGKNFFGSQLDSPKFFKIITNEANKHNLDTIIAIRDLDAVSSNKIKLKERMDWADKVFKVVNVKKKCFLLNVTMLESLILADIEVFNKQYKVKAVYKKNPEHEINPKQFLRNLTYGKAKVFEPNDCPEIFKRLNIENLRKCKHFDKFLVEFSNN
ncbi:MAG: DUF4276 family protein [Bacteroidetes bacterium]|nr:MAG: DUF4276 family protein [Bacteroidota bacterium]